MAKSCNILKYLVLTCLMVIAFPALSYSQIHTTRLEPAASSFSLEKAYQVAGIYWLPDYLKDNTSRDYNTNTDNEDPGGGDVEKTCETYGYASPGSVDLNLYDCTDYNLKPVHGLTCYTGCTCKSKFKYDSSNCSGNYKPSGTSCGDKYESCVCASGYKLCNGKCISNSSCCTNSDCGTNQSCNNGVCSCASGYKSCNGTCIPNSSCCTNSDCGTDEICSNGTCVTTCTYTITAADCSSECKSAGTSSCVRGGTTYYASCGASKCGSDQTCTNGTCVDNCKPLSDEENCKWGTKNCSDNCGGYRSCCKTAAEYCTENGYKSGIVCEKGQTTELCPADSNYKKCSGNGCPASQTCTYGCKTYSSQSGCSDVCTACYDDNCHNRTAVSVPANASCSDYYDDCPSKCSAWACKSGYNKSGNSCVCATTCKDTATVPANATAVKSNCTACGQTYSIVTGFTCNSGYTKSGNSCVCATTCTDSVTSKPANSYYTTKSCTACGVSKTIKTGWACNSGYKKSGNSCVKDCASISIMYYVNSDTLTCSATGNIDYVAPSNDLIAIDCQNGKSSSDGSMFASKSGFSFGYFGSNDGDYCNPQISYISAGETVRVDMSKVSECYGDFMKNEIITGRLRRNSFLRQKSFACELRLVD